MWICISVLNDHLHIYKYVLFPLGYCTMCIIPCGKSWRTATKVRTCHQMRQSYLKQRSTSTRSSIRGKNNSFTMRTSVFHVSLKNHEPQNGRDDLVLVNHLFHLLKWLNNIGRWFVMNANTGISSVGWRIGGEWESNAPDAWLWYWNWSSSYTCCEMLSTRQGIEGRISIYSYTYMHTYTWATTQL